MSLSEEMRKRLLQRRRDEEAEIFESGPVINLKNFSSGVFRFLTSNVNGVPDLTVAVTSLYCKGLPAKVKKFTISPRTFGLKDPVANFLDRQRSNMGKDEFKAEYGEMVNVRKQQYVLCLVQDDLGTASEPNLRIFPMASSLWVNRENTGIFNVIMGDPEDESEPGEDITDPDTGCWVKVRRKGSGLDTVWSHRLLDRGPITDDVKLQKAIVAAAGKYDLLAHIPKPDIESLAAMYDYVTGNELPDKYREPLEELCKADKKKTVAVPSRKAEEPDEVDDEDVKPKAKPKVEEPDDEDVKPKAKPKVEEPEEDETPKPKAKPKEAPVPEKGYVYAVGQNVRMLLKDDKGESYESAAVILSTSRSAKSGKPMYKVEDSDGNEWDVFESNLAPSEDEKDAEPEPEPEDPKPVSRKPKAEEADEEDETPKPKAEDPEDEDDEDDAPAKKPSTGIRERMRNLGR